MSSIFDADEFDADEDDIDTQNAQYTDILLACTRHLLEDLQGSANPRPVLSWLEECWDDLKDLANTKVEFEKLGVEAQINQFAKLTATLRGVPRVRQQIRMDQSSHDDAHQSA